MNFYQKLGGLILGSRLRRLSEYFLSEVNKVYAEKGIAFDASWFSMFYLISKNEHISLIDIAEALEVSHSAISQLAKSLEQKGLLESYPSEHDGRKRLVRFTDQGRQLQQAVEPVWAELDQAMQELMHENEANTALLSSLMSVEQSFAQKSLSQRLLKQ